MVKEKSTLATGNKAAMSAANKLLAFGAVVAQGDKPSTVSDITTVVAISAAGVVEAMSKKAVATRTATESNVLNVGETGIVVRDEQKDSGSKCCN
eukprot:14005438-Ditylum_brightwellii.AAC.1